MAMGTRRRRQRLWYHRDLAEAPGRPSYRRLNKVVDRQASTSSAKPAATSSISVWLGAAASSASGMLRGKTIGIDATKLEANAAMNPIVRRDTELFGLN